MALSLIEQNYVLSHKVNPTAITAFELLIMASRTHNKFLTNVLRTATEPSEDLQSFINKMDALNRRLLVNDNSFFQQVWVEFVNEISPVPSVTYQGLKAETDENWITLANTHIPKVFETLATISPDEKTAWDAFYAIYANS